MALTYLLLLFCILALTLQYLNYHWKRRNFYKIAAKLPGTEKSWIVVLLSLAFASRKNFIHKFLSFMRRDTPATKIWVGSSLYLFTQDPEFVDKVLTHSDLEDKPTQVYKPLMIEKSLVTLTGDEHRRSRKILNKAFTAQALQQLMNTFDATSKDILRKMETVAGGHEFNPMDFVGAFILDSFARKNLNFELNSYKTEILEIFNNFFRLCGNLLTYSVIGISIDILKYFKVGREILESIKKLEQFAENVIKWNQDTKSHDKNSLISLLLEPMHEFDDEQIRNQTIMIAMGAFDTTSKTLSALLMMLGMHKDVQHKVIDEIDEICGHENEIKFNSDFLRKFTYLEAVINETLRLFTTIPGLSRLASKDLEINGYLIPKDTIVTVSLYGIHRDERFWGSDAHLFKPERFLGHLEYPKAFVPFGEGRRMCIGYKYALNAMKIFLINFLRTYRVNSSYKYEELETELGFTLKFVAGNKINIVRRRDLNGNIVG